MRPAVGGLDPPALPRFGAAVTDAPRNCGSACARDGWSGDEIMTLPAAVVFLAPPAAVSAAVRRPRVAMNAAASPAMMSTPAVMPPAMAATLAAAGPGACDAAAASSMRSAAVTV